MGWWMLTLADGTTQRAILRGPRRPTNMEMLIHSREAVVRLGVKSIDKPTVPNADIYSKINTSSRTSGWMMVMINTPTTFQIIVIAIRMRARLTNSGAMV